MYFYLIFLFSLEGQITYAEISPASATASPAILLPSNVTTGTSNNHQIASSTRINTVTTTITPPEITTLAAILQSSSLIKESQGFLQCLRYLEKYTNFYLINHCQQNIHIDVQIGDFIYEEMQKNQFVKFILQSNPTSQSSYNTKISNRTSSFYNFTPPYGTNRNVTNVTYELKNSSQTFKYVWMIKAGCNKTVVQHYNLATTTTTIYTTTMKVRFEEGLFELIIHLINCIWIIITTFVTLIILALIKSFSFMRCIQMGQDFTLFLSHILILLVCNRVDIDFPCKLVGLTMQYLYTCLFLFLLMESIQSYCLVTNVLWNGGFMQLKTCMVICFGFPVVVVAITGAIGWHDLASRYSCWINFGKLVKFGTLIPLLIIICIIFVIVESTGQRTTFNVPAHRGQLIDAKISQHILTFKVPANVGSWIIGSVAFYYPGLGWFSIMLPFNIVLGWFILTFHLLGNEKVIRDTLPQISARSHYDIHGCSDNFDMQVEQHLLHSITQYQHYNHV